MSGEEVYETELQTSIPYLNDYSLTIFNEHISCDLCKDNKITYFGNSDVKLCLDCCNNYKRKFVYCYKEKNIKKQKCTLMGENFRTYIDDEFTFYYSIFLRDCFYDLKANGIKYGLSEHCAFKFEKLELMVYLSNYKPYESNIGKKTLCYNFHSDYHQYIPYKNYINSFEIIKTFKKNQILF